eukprot:4109659-Amphidinium_carterae.1
MSTTRHERYHSSHVLPKVPVIIITLMGATKHPSGNHKMRSWGVCWSHKMLPVVGRRGAEQYGGILGEEPTFQLHWSRAAKQKKLPLQERIRVKLLDDDDDDVDVNDDCDLRRLGRRG